MLIIRRPTDNGLEKVGRDSAIDLSRRRDSNLWFHCDTPNDDELRFLQEHLKIHDLTVEDIVNQNQRPKLESFDVMSTWRFICCCAKTPGKSNLRAGSVGGRQPMGRDRSLWSCNRYSRQLSAA